MFRDYWKYDWVLDVHRYESVSDLCATFEEAVVLHLADRTAYPRP